MVKLLGLEPTPSCFQDKRFTTMLLDHCCLQITSHNFPWEKEIDRKVDTVINTPYFSSPSPPRLKSNHTSKLIDTICSFYLLQLSRVSSNFPPFPPCIRGQPTQQPRSPWNNILLHNLWKLPSSPTAFATPTPSSRAATSIAYYFSCAVFPTVIFFPSSFFGPG